MDKLKDLWGTPYGKVMLSIVAAFIVWVLLGILFSALIVVLKYSIFPIIVFIGYLYWKHSRKVD